MKKQTYKGEIKRSFIYSCKRVFLDGPLFMFLIISVVCMLALLLLLPLVLKNGNADAPLFIHTCNSNMDKYYELYKSSGDVQYFYKYQYFSLIVSNNLKYDKFFVIGSNPYDGLGRGINLSRYSCFVSFIPFIFLLLCPFLSYQLFFSNENKTYYKNVLSTNVSKRNFITGKLICYCAFVLIAYFLFYLIGFSIVDGDYVLLFNGSDWEKIGLIDICSKRIPFGLLSSLTFASIVLLLGSLFSKGMDFAIFGGIIFIALFIAGIYLNSTFLKLDYVLSLTENVILNTSLLSIFIRIVEGILLIGISLFTFIYKTKKHS